MILHARNVAEAVLASMTEDQLAGWRREEGHRTVLHGQRYWTEIARGFYQPIHWLAQLLPEQAHPPGQLWWGFRAALFPGGAACTNGTIPIHVLSDIENYGPHSLSSKRRSQLRRCRRVATIVELMDPQLLREQGHKVVQSARHRTRYAKPPSHDAYIASLATYIQPGRRLVLAGMVDGTLGGYLAGFAVDGTAYIDEVHLATEFLSSDLGTGLVVDFVQICQRSGGIGKVVYGLHARENESLCAFKQKMLFRVQHIPARVRINPVIGTLLRWRYPHKYYRLTGHTP